MILVKPRTPPPLADHMDIYNGSTPSNVPAKAKGEVGDEVAEAHHRARLAIRATQLTVPAASLAQVCFPASDGHNASTLIVSAEDDIAIAPRFN